MLARVKPSSATIAILGVGLVLVFTFGATTGFHETANAGATVVHSLAMRPTPAVIRSGLMNAVGVLAGGIAAASADLTGAAGRAVGARQFPGHDHAGRPVRVGMLPEHRDVAVRHPQRELAHQRRAGQLGAREP